MFTKELSPEVKAKARKAGFSISKAFAAFVEAVDAGFVDLAGANWRARPKEEMKLLLEALREKLKPVLCTEADGPQWPAADYGRLFQGAMLGAIYKIPLRLCNQLGWKDMPHLVELVSADGHDDPIEEKIKRAAGKIAADKHKAKGAPPFALPLPDAGDDNWGATVLLRLKDYFNLPDSKTLLAAPTPEAMRLKMISDLVSQQEGGAE